MTFARLLVTTLCSTALFVSLAGCKVDVSFEEEFEETDVARTDSADYAGEEIVIDIQGVGISTGTTGVNVTAREGVTRVNSKARIIARTFKDEKDDADKSIIDAKATYNITRSGNVINVTCGHGGSYGNSNGGESGCELINIDVPLGTAQQPLKLTIKGGSGDMTVQLTGATIKNVGISQSGLGVTNVELPSTGGANIGANVEITSHKGEDIAVTVPADWSSDKVWLQADADKIVNNFTDVTAVDNSVGRGAVGTGLASLKVTSIKDISETGTITLRSR